MLATRGPAPELAAHGRRRCCRGDWAGLRERGGINRRDLLYASFCWVQVHERRRARHLSTAPLQPQEAGRHSQPGRLPLQPHVCGNEYRRTRSHEVDARRGSHRPQSRRLIGCGAARVSGCGRSHSLSYLIGCHILNTSLGGKDTKPVAIAFRCRSRCAVACSRETGLKRGAALIKHQPIMASVGSLRLVHGAGNHHPSVWFTCTMTKSPSSRKYSASC